MQDLLISIYYVAIGLLTIGAVVQVARNLRHTLIIFILTAAIIVTYNA